MRGWKTGLFAAVDADYPKRGNVSLLLRKTIAKREWEKGGEREGRSRKRRGKERERS